MFVIKRMRYNTSGAVKGSILITAGLLIIILVILTMLISTDEGISPVRTAVPVMKDYARYRVNYRVIARNEYGNRSLAGRLYLPLPRDSWPYQEVDSVSVNPAPLETVTDKDNNEIGIFPLTIRALRDQVVSVSFEVTVHHVAIPLKAAGKGRLPSFTSSYLSSDRVFDYDLPELKRIVNSVNALEPIPFYRLVNLYDFVRENYTYRESSSPRSLREVLRDGVVQCSDVNILFVSMCRASGIPATYVGGLYVSRDKEAFPQTHAWTRVWLEGIGWIPVDPALGRFDLRSRYLCFGEQRRFYIELWNGFTTPAVFRPERGDARQPALALKMDLYPSVWEHKPDVTLSTQAPCRPARLPESLVKEQFDDLSLEHFSRGKAFERQQNLTKALEEFDNAIRLSPEFARAHRERIKCLFILEKGEDALLCYRGMYEASPRSTLCKYYYALCLVHKKRYSTAERLLLECEREGFVSSELYNSIGYIYLMTKQLLPAEESFGKALCAAGDHFSVYENLMAMFQNAEEWEKMCDWAMKGLKEYPDNQFFQGQLGFGLIESGQPGEALRYLARAIEHDTSMGWYYALMGWAYRDLGNTGLARENLKEGLRLKKGIGYMKYYEDMLKELDTKEE